MSGYLLNPLSVAAAASLTANASTISSARLVAAANTSSAVRYANIETKATGTRRASIVIQPNETILIEKNLADEIFASTGADGTGDATDVLFTKLGF